MEVFTTFSCDLRYFLLYSFNTPEVSSGHLRFITSHNFNSGNV